MMTSGELWTLVMGLYLRVCVGFMLLALLLRVLFPPPAPTKSQPVSAPHIPRRRRLPWAVIGVLIALAGPGRLALRVVLDPLPISEAWSAPLADDIVAKLGEGALAGRIVLVTGASTGIGLETARALVKGGATVVLGARSLGKAKAAADEINNDETAGKRKGKAEVMEGVSLELGSLSSVVEFARAFKENYSKLDILVLNAGMLPMSYEVSEQQLPLTFAVNHVGHFYLNKLLLPLMKKGQSPAPRVVVVSSCGPMHFARSTENLTLSDIILEDSSRMAFLTDPIRGMREYAHTKLANVMFARELAKRNPHIRVYSLHPGLIQTELGAVRYDPSKSLLETGVARILSLGQYLFYASIPFKKTLQQGAATTVYVATDPSLENQTGKYYSDCAEAAPFPVTQDDELTTALWEYTENIISNFKL